ncbi:MAG: hypothetical protein B7Z73_05530 [Planctomycetia bacterium 21-64-5]|nr:MAG: hypothetical protein B7Z73_05530 [Planctomycetia bacterium 21-64-5]
MNLLAMRELQKWEMPTDWQDIADMSSGPPYNPASLFVLPTVPGTAMIYLSKFNAAASVPGITSQQLAANGPAECLYLIVTMGPGQTEMFEEFGVGHVGDVDGDGLPEFQDGWLPPTPSAYATSVPSSQGMKANNPIFWIRWPAGYVDDPMASPPLVGLDASPLYAPGATTATAITMSDVNHDPYDPLKLDIPKSQSGPARGYALKPLIYSGGSDGLTGINVNGNTNAYDPYAPDSSGNLRGQPIGTAWQDNVTNRQFSGRVQ